MDWLARFLTPSRRQQLGSGSACVTLKSLQAEPGPWLGEGTQRLRMRSQGRGAVVDSRERASWATLAGVLFYQALRALTLRIPGLGQQGEADARGCCCSWREALAACLGVVAGGPSGQGGGGSPQLRELGEQKKGNSDHGGVGGEHRMASSNLTPFLLLHPLTSSFLPPPNLSSRESILFEALGTIWPLEPPGQPPAQFPACSPFPANVCLTALEGIFLMQKSNCVSTLLRASPALPIVFHIKCSLHCLA